MKLAVTSMYSAYKNDWRVRSFIILPMLIVWLGILSSADSFFSPYIFYALLCMVSCASDSVRSQPDSKRVRVYFALFSIMFSLSIVLANYGILAPLKGHIFDIAFLFLGGILIGWYILKLFLREGNRKISRRDENGKANFRWFVIPFLLISLIYLLVLIFCYKPGFLTMDSLNQVNQNTTGIYNNSHPFWHTMLIKVFMDLGMSLFNDFSAAVLVYHVFQVLCMAAVFSFISMTMFQAGVPKAWIVISLLFYAILPYHIMYSMTMWKDVLFGGAVALFVCSLYRVLKNIRGRKLNHIVLIISSFGCCLLRSNGMAAFLFTLIVLAIILRNKKARVILVLSGVFLVSFIMKRPVLKALDIPQPNMTESISIPLQQFARLIVDEEQIDEDELHKLEQIMNPESVRKEYKPYLSDPIKNIVLKNQPHLIEHKLDYLLLWLQLGIKHPASYFRAWIDQTRGYWNAGYEYWIVTYGIIDNEYGLAVGRPENLVAKLMRPWVVKFFFHPAFELFRSIGLHVWTIILCFFMQIIRKRKEALLFVLPLALVLTLLISTPVFSEFRYIYSIFTSFPFLVFISFVSEKEKSEVESPVIGLSAI